MRVVVILSVVLPLAVVWVWVVTRPIVNRIRREQHLAELERENERLDALLHPEQHRHHRDSHMG
ncbi:MAG TPA: hypothetical protein VG964_01190 [Candidatus Saccharimonadales bacterium]|nr:hypothetical protein [Candidatus Saccharimonadales bacterium]